ncbi:type VI secretion system Vgr family protein [Lacinutrix sp. 5H-3-7-4]|uniref:type VI secretion system Vgr family protein n=1 Tax=Lacinutrix sp. (strain 5H-3-7-4) TaxID=983544 RepID=UPI00020A3903|nr:phage baseplate assembly protein V [Lacinutrix sp. 5H-3-7-4]AEH02101.1 Rhs element Vgr protein [Lacinutrix sp. 5H-3-7-4]
MAILSTTYIHINGNQLPYYNSCSLHQEIGGHHILNLTCLQETIDFFCNNNNIEIHDLLAAIITVETKSFADIDFHGTLKFKGIITSLNHNKGLYGTDGNLVAIEAKSTTIISDDGPHHTSFNDMSFVDIIEDNFSSYDTSKLKINTKNSKLTEPLIYTVQYNESCFAFAQRMAARNGEWMYYNGEELVFGIDTNTEETELKLGRDLQDYSTSLKPVAQNFKYFTNDYIANDIHEAESSATTSASEGHFTVVNDSSKDIYTKPTRIWLNISDDSKSKSRLDKYADLQQQSLQSNQVVVSGTSDNPGVMLASTIKISESTYRVTKVIHSYSSNGEYENYFEAASTNVDVYPKTKINAFPMAHSQTAKVIENHDPEGMGRVKVQFPWQKPDGLTTPWIRSISPSASQGQGFFFIPEVDDEVLVDFEGGNAEAPFVMGGVYNSQSIPPDGSANENNHIKMLKTRSGSFFKLNDEDGSITIQDKAGSSIVLDGSGNIQITAVSNVSVTGPESVSTSADAVSTDAGTSISQTSGKTYSVSSGEEASIIAGKKVAVNGATQVTVDSTDVAITGTAKATVSSSGTTAVEGTIIKLN